MDERKERINWFASLGRAANQSLHESGKLLSRLKLYYLYFTSAKAKNNIYQYFCGS
jgi:hypothetical protein